MQSIPAVSGEAEGSSSMPKKRLRVSPVDALAFNGIISSREEPVSKIYEMFS